MTCQKGVSIYLAIIIIFILLGIALGLSTLLVGQIKLVRGLGDSVVAFYAADTGVEKALYEEKLCRQTTGCPLPPSCRACCQGLPNNTTIQGNLDNPVSSASYTTTITYGGSPEIIHFTSRGEYKGTKRAIDTSIPQSPALSFTPWQSCQTVPVGSVSFSWRLGYRFIPNINMTVKELCGRWSNISTRLVVLQGSNLAALPLASVNVSSGGSNNWTCVKLSDVSLPDVPLTAGQTYYVSEKGSNFYQENLPFLLPKDCSNVSIKATCIDMGGGTQFTGAVNCGTTDKMFGEVDFVATCE